MPTWIKHAGLFIAGAACIVGGVFVPPASAFLGPIGTKLIIAAGAVSLLGTSTDTLTGAVKDAATAIKNRPGKGQSGS
jgi:uncharacterized membrane protein